MIDFGGTESFSIESYSTRIGEESCEVMNQRLRMKVKQLEKKKITDVYMNSPKVVGALMFGLSTICFVSLSIFASITGDVAFSKALLIPVIPSAIGAMILVPLLYKGY